jgi:predicted DNA-binding transcriptional regulator AlpA
MAPTTDRLLSTREAADVLGVRESTLVAWRSRGTPGRPQPVKVGSRRVAYAERELIAYRDRESKVVSWSGDSKKSTPRRQK